MENILKITTASIKKLIGKRNKVRDLEDKIRVLRNELTIAKKLAKSDEEMIINALKQGVEVMSNMFTLEVIEHHKMGYVNWQQKFKEYLPLEYENIKKANENKANWNELLIARR